MNSPVRSARIHISGVVQGVGFRPFVYHQAVGLHLNGWVRNTSAGVDILVEGPLPALQTFISNLQSDPPPLAQIDDLQTVFDSPQGLQGFEIISSEGVPNAFLPISPDVAVCPDCLRELFDKNDRRYRYPFINCTNCGPRFTIIRDIPYDRPKTTMAAFAMCPACAREYHDPADRRFHAQPVACPNCGPHLWLETTLQEGRAIDTPPGDDEAVIHRARLLLVQGKILAVKGLGGFHLACDATNPSAVAELRRRKGRVDKPFALMMADEEAVRRHTILDEAGWKFLTAIQRPILIVPRRPSSPVAGEVSPGQNSLGVMLPYTPLHYVLMERDPGFPDALVMTSANFSEEPIATMNDEAKARLSDIADAFLMHDRDIYMRSDDSVVQVFKKRLYPLRRGRGYAPLPLLLGHEMPPLLACGTELKNTFCLTKERYAFLSHHNGNLQNYETLQAYEEGIRHFEYIFRVEPAALAYDLHPDYLATRYALERAERQGLPALGVQHHHAHIAACMAENRLADDRPVIGLAFDGTGYGEDGAIWGGEVLIADYTGFRRRYHLAYIPLAGGDLAVNEPWRPALAWLRHAGIPWREDLPPLAALSNDPHGQQKVSVLRRQLEGNLNCVSTSSMGRLFDAAAALAGVRQTVNYEAQAAIEFEALAAHLPDSTQEIAYPFALNGDEIEAAPAIQALLDDLHAALPVERIALRFHIGVAELALHICRQIRREEGLASVVLSGGVWQNMLLLRQTVRRLEQADFKVFVHEKVPANDGGVSLGQAVIAAHRLIRSAA